MIIKQFNDVFGTFLTNFHRIYSRRCFDILKKITIRSLIEDLFVSRQIRLWNWYCEWILRKGERTWCKSCNLRMYLCEAVYAKQNAAELEFGKKRGRRFVGFIKSAPASPLSVWIQIDCIARTSKWVQGEDFHPICLSIVSSLAQKQNVPSLLRSIHDTCTITPIILMWFDMLSPEFFHPQQEKSSWNVIGDIKRESLKRFRSLMQWILLRDKLGKFRTFVDSDKRIKMYKLVILMLMACYAVELNAQTFQYSRGWTNGKRSGNSVTDLPPLRQMMPSPMVQVLTANDFNNRER